MITIDGSPGCSQAISMDVMAGKLSEACTRSYWRAAVRWTGCSEL